MTVWMSCCHSHVCFYLHSCECVDAVSEKQLASCCWLLGDPKVKEPNPEITLLGED